LEQGWRRLEVGGDYLMEKETVGEWSAVGERVERRRPAIEVTDHLKKLH
jgi:hypothetical protein